jgi:alpha-D-ribose 1-methylphosphonate 5-triphosphate synthase subunit PhnG
MSALALATRDDVEAAWRRLPDTPTYTVLRGPETGLVMVRARAGGTGMRFNLGETPVVRCSVQVDGGAVGHAWVRGRDCRHAELAAALDALLQDPERRTPLMRGVVEPLEAVREARRRAALERAAQTRVDFFTMVRGED